MPLCSVTLCVTLRATLARKVLESPLPCSIFQSQKYTFFSCHARSERCTQSPLGVGSSSLLALTSFMERGCYVSWSGCLSLPSEGLSRRVRGGWRPGGLGMGHWPWKSPGRGRRLLSISLRGRDSRGNTGVAVVFTVHCLCLRERGRERESTLFSATWVAGYTTISPAPPTLPSSHSPRPHPPTPPHSTVLWLALCGSASQCSSCLGNGNIVS